MNNNLGNKEYDQQQIRNTEISKNQTTVWDQGGMGKLWLCVAEAWVPQTPRGWVSCLVVTLFFSTVLRVDSCPFCCYYRSLL